MFSAGKGCGLFPRMCKSPLGMFGIPCSGGNSPAGFRTAAASSAAAAPSEEVYQWTPVGSVISGAPEPDGGAGKVYDCTNGGRWAASAPGVDKDIYVGLDAKIQYNNNM